MSNLPCSTINDAILGNRRTWIGLSDTEEEGSFVWIDGVVATPKSTRWVVGQPDGSNVDEDCAYLNEENRRRHFLSDTNCRRKFHALCEKVYYT